MVQDEFEPRPGRIRGRGSDGAFIGQALAAAQRAGGLYRPTGGKRSVFGRGRAAGLAAGRGLGTRSRRVVIKARVVRQRAGRAPLSLHLNYLQREGVTQEGDRGHLFDAAGEAASGQDFIRRSEADRHHFRFILSPEDAAQLADLKAFTRDLMRQAEADLRTRLDWVAVEHWNTGQPHVHVIVRGRDEAGEDLVISRDYIAEGLRARAVELATLELGPRSDQEIRRSIDQQVQADRWTELDRRLAGQIGREDGLIDMRRPARGASNATLAPRMARLRRLELMGLAEEVRPGRWRLDPAAETTLRDLGRRGDIIAQMHRAIRAQGIATDPAQFVLEGEAPVIGRLIGRGLDDELKASAFAVIDGLDGRIHHVRLQDLADASDAPLGAIVETRRLGEGRGHVVAVRSDLSLAEQVAAVGATWIDRQLISRAPSERGQGGFADEVVAALGARTEHLVGEGLAKRVGRRVIFVRDLLATLRARDLATAAASIARETGLEHQRLEEGGVVSGVFRRRLDLASGRFAVIEGSLGFSLVPWRADLERRRGQEVGGAMGAGGQVEWAFGRSRGPSR